MNAPHLPQGAIFVLMRQCLRFAYGGRFLRRCLRFFRCLRLTAGGRFCVFGGVCVWRRAAVFCGVLRLAAGVRALRAFFAAVFAFFAVFVFDGGRAGDAGIFAVCVWRRAAVLAAV